MRGENTSDRVPSQADLADALDRDRFDWLVDCYEVAGSCLVSAREAARRGQSIELVKGHAAQARRALAEAAEIEEMLGKPEPVA
jgi:hypothetical protein